MNLILFDRNELEQPLSRHDPRANHILTVLRRHLGDGFDVGIVNGPRGKAYLRQCTPDALILDFRFDTETSPLHPVTLLIGLPRPQTARRILREATTLGVSALHFVQTEKGEASYRQSRLWTTDEYKHHLRQGAEQAFCTQLPALQHFDSLAEALTAVPASSNRIALDNYEAGLALSVCQPEMGHSTLAIGGERGWSNKERDLLRDHNFTLAHLGTRVLKTETACVAGLTLLLAGMDLL